ncbi:Pycsar system effector family protein [Pseudomonas monteilii]|uniref:Pycsar system effector family protein n=1 Tax=Pseudomonas monteilii TaxID=76759 RepID=UPI00086372E5|nr:Pycsar system effector family protein [Pseudomonas monteilii]
MTFSIQDKIKTQLEIMKRIDSHIASTNAKCAIVMSYCAAVLGWLAVNSNKMLEEITDPKINTLASIFMTIGIALTVACLVFALKITFPATHSSDKGHRGKSMVFFGDVASQKLDEYVARFSQLESSETLDDLSTQIHTLSGIADRKFNDLQHLISLVCFGSVLPVGIFMLVKIFGKG